MKRTVKRVGEPPSKTHNNFFDNVLTTVIQKFVYTFNVSPERSYAATKKDIKGEPPQAARQNIEKLLNHSVDFYYGVISP